MSVLAGTLQKWWEDYWKKQAVTEEARNLAQQQQEELQRRVEEEGITAEQFEKKYGDLPETVPEEATIIDVKEDPKEGTVSFQYVTKEERELTAWEGFLHRMVYGVDLGENALEMRILPTRKELTEMEEIPYVITIVPELESQMVTGFTAAPKGYALRFLGETEVPPTVISAIFSEEERARLLAEGPAYIYGSLLYEVAEAYLGYKIGTKIFSGVAKYVPKGASVVAHPLGRATLVGGQSAVEGYIYSGGDIEVAAKSGLLGGGFSLGIEYLVSPLIQEVRARLPSRFGGVSRMDVGPETIGKSGKSVGTYITEPIEALDDRGLRIVGDVTEEPIWTKQDLQDFIDTYVGKPSATGHATLSPQMFDLSEGGETILKGIPEEGMGYRSAQELYGFYTAPSPKRYVTLYGGYMGIGEGYSEGSKLIIGGKPTGIITTETVISKQFLRQAGETQAEWYSRVMALSGETGIALETLAGVSLERQFTTTTRYARFGEELAGSKLVVEDIIGTFQVKELPEGILGKIPVLRTIFAEYTTVNVVKGVFEPTTLVKGQGIKGTQAILDVGAYAKSYAKSVSVPSISARAPSLASFITKSQSKMSTNILSGESRISKPSRISESIISRPSKPSKPISSVASSILSSSSGMSGPSHILSSQTSSHYLRKQLKKRRQRPVGFESWFFQKHPIPTVSEVGKHILG